MKCCSTMCSLEAVDGVEWFKTRASNQNPRLRYWRMAGF